MGPTEQPLTLTTNEAAVIPSSMKSPSGSKQHISVITNASGFAKPQGELATKKPLRVVVMYVCFSAFYYLFPILNLTIINQSFLYSLGDPSKEDPILPGGKADEDDLETIEIMKKSLVSLGDNWKFEFLSNHDTMLEELKDRKEKGEIDLVLQVN
jgi:hypothetical protein